MDHIDINASQAVYLGWCLPGHIYTLLFSLRRQAERYEIR